MRSIAGRILVTGADGFVGRALCAKLRSSGFDVRGVSRGCEEHWIRAIGDIGDFDQWLSILSGIDVVIHLSGRAHVGREREPDPLAEFRRVNVTATERLARSSVSTGVRRFVFVSSIGVNGAMTTDRRFTENDPPEPTEPYAISKYEAELRLREIEISSNLELVIVRPSLVYGPHVKGNFLRLLRLVHSGLPLPFGTVKNLRSFLGVDNFCELLTQCVVHPDAAGELFLAADDEDLSTPELLVAMGYAMGRRSKIRRVPLGFLRMLAMLTRRSNELQRLTDSLQVDSSRSRAILGWSPVLPVREGLALMAKWYISEGCR